MVATAFGQPSDPSTRVRLNVASIIAGSVYKVVNPHATFHIRRRTLLPDLSQTSVFTFTLSIRVLVNTS